MKCIPLKNPFYYYEYYNYIILIRVDGKKTPSVDDKEREAIIQEFLSRKREAEANKARAILDNKSPNSAPWEVNDWNYKINPAKKGCYA